MPGHRADPDFVDTDPHVAELVVQVVDVDEVLEIGQTQLHHREEAVASCHQTCLLAQPLEQADGMVDAGGTFVLERRGYLHWSLRVTWVTRLSAGRRTSSTPS